MHFLKIYTDKIMYKRFYKQEFRIFEHVIVYTMFFYAIIDFIQN